MWQRKPARLPGTSKVAVLMALLAASVSCGAEPLELGANFNENLQAARLPTLKAASTTWIRGFLPALEFIEGERELGDDTRIRTFRVAGEAGYKIVLSLKWDFREAERSVPSPGSPEEGACFEWAVAAIDTLKPDLVCLVNETFVDTAKVDLEPDESGRIANVDFLKRLAHHVSAQGLKTPHGEPLRLSSGGLTRLDDPEKQQHPATVALLEWLRTTEDVDCVNFHIHHRTAAEVDEALEFMRHAIPDKPFVITEFSPVWSYESHRHDQLGQAQAGQEFAQQYGLDSALTVRQYLNSCFENPVPEQQYHDFLATLSWLDPNYLGETCDKMQRAGVTLATYAFVQEASGGQGPLRERSTLWTLNPIFVDLMTVSSNPARPGINPGLFADFVDRQRAISNHSDGR